MLGFVDDLPRLALVDLLNFAQACRSVCSRNRVLAPCILCLMRRLAISYTTCVYLSECDKRDITSWFNKKGR